VTIISSVVKGIGLSLKPYIRLIAVAASFTKSKKCRGGPALTCLTSCRMILSPVMPIFKKEETIHLLMRINRL